MQSFKQFITISEANEKRFLKFLQANKNLTKEQAKEINAFFNKYKQAAKKFEKDYGWQSQTTKDLTYEDFGMIMNDSSLEVMKALKKIKIPGTKEVDYQPVHIKNKGFIANIPLTQDTAQYMNSCKYGNLDVNYCIGWDEDGQYWDEYVIDEQKVPVYLTNGVKKWVVMIEDGNRSYEVWDMKNDENKAKSNKEPIPGFSIKKELLTSSLKKMYNEIREEFYTEDNKLNSEPPKPDWSEAKEDYDNLVREIETVAKDFRDRKHDNEEELKEIWTDTLKDYKLRLKNIREEILSFEKKQALIQEKIDALEVNIDNLTSQENIELQKLINELDNITDTLSELEDKEVDLEIDLDNIEDIDYKDEDEMQEERENYDWNGFIPDAGDWRNSMINWPDPEWYSDFVEYVEHVYGDYDWNKLKNEISDYIYDQLSYPAWRVILLAGIDDPEV
jgi:hypothetical protein